MEELLPNFYDANDLGGVRLTITPNNRLFKKRLKKYSRSIAVGESIDITLILKKLPNFDSHYWEKRKIISKLPERKEDYTADVDWGDEEILIKRMVSIKTDCEGEVYYRIPKVQFSIYDFDGKNSPTIYSAKVISKELRRKNIIISIGVSFIVSFIVGIFLLGIQFITGIY
jgi:hypothetical protein